ncbi:Na(+)-translocating NADH-quinone reductase subunit C [Marinicella meishanensis]|uniref:Na(+)-translocating NADH-quinone reductase subunit C n=1 Tax=Marinicella meishanensis TaxID=2873263 RepID=UPI001CBC05A0|nr:Na(+)-translocating NADH-quinone reductase subunit C [Marinicella sp. NBU2979]
MPRNKESTGFVVTVAIVLSLVCATLVSVAAIGLKPIQEVNAAKEKKKNILMAAGIYQDGGDIEALFKDNIEVAAIAIPSGQPANDIDVNTFDAVKAAKDASTGQSLDDDPAKIGYIANHALVYQLKGEAGIEKVILPIRGYGLWGTMYGFLAMNKDGQTIEGLTFYEHKETPGLGAEIANPSWQATWVGKQPYDENNIPQMRLVKAISPNPDVAEHQVDTLAGATLTSRGVEATINFWLGERGYGPYLSQLASQE